MQEILSKTDDPNVPLTDQEFYELALQDSDNIWMGQCMVREARARWSCDLSQIVWDEVQVEYALNYDLAMQRYRVRRAALVQRGFVYSDMDW